MGYFYKLYACDGSGADRTPEQLVAKRTFPLWPFVVSVVAAIAIDQGTKAWVFETLFPPREEMAEILKEFATIDFASVSHDERVYRGLQDGGYLRMQWNGVAFYPKGLSHLFYLSIHFKRAHEFLAPALVLGGIAIWTLVRSSLRTFWAHVYRDFPSNRLFQFGAGLVMGSAASNFSHDIFKTLPINFINLLGFWSINAADALTYTGLLTMTLGLRRLDADGIKRSSFLG